MAPRRTRGGWCGARGRRSEGGRGKKGIGKGEALLKKRPQGATQIKWILTGVKEGVTGSRPEEIRKG